MISAIEGRALRSELPNLIALAERLLAVGEPAVLSTLFSARGPSYRPIGSMMVSGPPGIAAGGVSGGCLEEYVARHGRVLTQERPAAIISFDTDPDADDAKPVLGCGGSIEVLVERIAAEQLTYLRAVLAAYDADLPSTFLTETRIDSSGKVAVHRPSPRATAESAFEDARRQALLERKSRHVAASDVRAALVQYVPPLTRLVIFGAGDDVRPLASLGRSLGWHVTVADRRARLARAVRFPDADEIVAADWRDAIARIRFTPRTAAVLMTHSVPDDSEILLLIGTKPLAYFGALGPAHRREWLLERSDADGERAAGVELRGPIGLDLGERSAAGIAIAVIAEIMAALNGRDAAPLTGSPDSERQVEHARESVDA